ncbi:creatininase family protein [Oceanirhabdus sp. W0125-5]|uniref:creatininase family protein n=1 Tax=Oceanirhabdus sp. W0125-5 TaxID=2999116 RepID=UPI0022F2B371|nr:creatininase family protein [Oceanirhabdus sp. W0125-5]WBW96427.1 creatininase family protein [Oceanirhabdus sp. W0125-5]
MKFGKCTYLEIKQKAEEGYIAIIPTGCTEQQGPHATVDFDTWFAEELMDEVSERLLEKHGVKSLVLPAIPFGPTPEHVNFGSGYINIPQNLYEELIYSIFKSLSDQGFKKLILWRGCGGHYLDNVVSKFNADNEGVAEVFNIPHPFYEVWCNCGDSSIEGGHSDSFTTSIGLYRHPEDIRVDKIVNPYSTEPEWNDPNLDFSKYSKTGVIGDPTHASAELGEKLWNEVVNKVVDMLNDLK